MIKQVMALAVVAALTACSGDSSETPPASTAGSTAGTTSSGTTTGTTATGGTGGTTGTTAGTDTGGTVTPSGGLPGVWVGPNDFGEAVMVIDASENVFALAANNSGQFESVFGPASSQLQQFFHRESFNAATRTSFTLAGDRPSQQDASASDTKTYNLAVQNDGQQITNSATGSSGNFQMTLANLNDLPAISLADVAGTWTANTSFECEGGCEIVLTMTIAAGGAVSGNTDFNTGAFVAPLNGNAAAANGSNQYLTVSFVWNGLNRSGVLYRDRNDTSRLIVNTVGPDDGGNKSFSATMIRSGNI